MPTITYASKNWVGTVEKIWDKNAIETFEKNSGKTKQSNDIRYKKN